MKLSHEFDIPAPPEEAWPVLTDIERIGPCLPGAKITSVDGDEFTGEVKVKVGPIQVVYGGKARFVQKDESTRHAVIDARGKETRGSGTATATVTADLAAAGTGTKVTVVTDLAITGRPAQFGRGVMQEVGNKLLGQFADRLAGLLRGDSDAPEPVAPTATAAPATAAPAAAAPVEGTADAGAVDGANRDGHPIARPADSAAPRAGTGATRSQQSVDEPINLLEIAGGSIAKRLVPLVAALLAGLGALLWRRRSRS